jgi:hypothetical protein
VAAEVRALRAARGATPAPIRVKRFRLQDYRVGIDPHTEAQRELLEDPASVADEWERARQLEALRRWEADGSFVVCWGSGEVEVDERLYTLRTDGHDDGDASFYTCRQADGTQLLLGAPGLEVLAVRFSPEGDFLALERRPLGVTREALEQEIRTSFPDLDRSFVWQRACRALDEKTEAQLRAWRAELGASPGPIRVKRFHLEGYRVGIDPYFDFQLELLEDPESIPDEQERAEELEALRRWEARGAFVFWWGGNDMEMDNTGKVICT